MVHIDTGGRHLVAGVSTESVPSWSQGIVTLRWFVLVANHSSVSILEVSVLGAFWKQNYKLRKFLWKTCFDRNNSHYYFTDNQTTKRILRNKLKIQFIRMLIVTYTDNDQSFYQNIPSIEIKNVVFISIVFNYAAQTFWYDD